MWLEHTIGMASKNATDSPLDPSRARETTSIVMERDNLNDADACSTHSMQRHVRDLMAEVPLHVAQRSSVLLALPPGHEYVSFVLR